MPQSLDRHSVNTATLGYQMPIGETIDAIARAGFGGIAPWRREVEGGDIDVIARRIRDAGLRVSGYCRSTYIPGTSREAWAANVEDNRRALRDAARLGAECFVLVVGGLPEGSRDMPDARRQVQDGVADLLAEAATLGVPLALEPLHPMYAADRACVNTIRQALDLCTLLDPARTSHLGIAIDVYHTWWDPELPEAIMRAGREGRILAYHVNDWLVPTSDLLMDRGLPGEGVIDLDAIGSLVCDAGYRGLTEVEVFSHRVWRRPPDRILADCVASIIQGPPTCLQDVR